ncbi:MAG TPA: hypothetical protein VM266_04515 [Solirubrobacteraceae bacterium]|nr:hypothetical protein [Solirubrobacteraceae bacterium]
MTRLPAAAIAVVLLALPAPAAAAAPEPGCHGIQVTDKAGDSANSLNTSQAGSPSSDITAGWINYDPAAQKATANVRVVELTEGEVDPPFVAISWEFAMTTAAGPRFVRAYQDFTGMVKYTWGEPRAITDDQTAPRAGGPTTGALFPGKDGVISIDIPLADMGAKPGTQLKALGIEVRQWISLPAAVPSTGLPLFSPAPVYDSATGKAMTLEPCGAAAPADPAPGDPAEPGTPPAQQPAKLAVKVTVPKLTARKLAKGRRFTIGLKGTASQLVAQVRTSTQPDAKVLGSGKLARLNKKGKLTLKLRGKLKKGRYVLYMSGRNADGAAAEGAIGLRVR